MKYSLNWCNIYDNEGLSLPTKHCVWHEPSFMRSVAAMHQIVPYQLQVCKGEELIAILPLYEKRKFGLKALIAPVGTYYQGISIYHPPQTSGPRMLLDSLAITERIAKSITKKYHRVNIRLSPDNSDVRGFTWNSFKAKPLYTFSLNNEGEQYIMPEERRYLRRAEKNGMSFEEGYDPDLFMELQSKLDKRKGHTMGVSYPLLRRYFDSLNGGGLLRQYNSFFEGKAVSSSISLTNGKEIIYTLYWATELKFMNQGAAAFHCQKSFEELPDGIHTMDMCGANIQDVARFKAALGMQLGIFFEIHR